MKKFILTTVAAVALSTGMAHASAPFSPEGQQQELIGAGYPDARVASTPSTYRLVIPSENIDQWFFGADRQDRLERRVDILAEARGRAETPETFVAGFYEANDIPELWTQANIEEYVDDNPLPARTTRAQAIEAVNLDVANRQAGAATIETRSNTLPLLGIHGETVVEERFVQTFELTRNADGTISRDERQTNLAAQQARQAAVNALAMEREADRLDQVATDAQAEADRIAAEEAAAEARMEAERLARINARNAAKAKLNRMIGDDLQSSLLLETTESVFDNQYINDARITIRPEVGEVAIKLASSETFETPTHTLKATAQVRAGILGLGKDYSGTTHGLKLEGSAQAKDSETSYSLGYDSGTAYSYKGGKSGDFSGLKGNGRTDSSFYAGVSHTQTNGVKWGGKLDTDGVLDVELSKNGYSLGANSEGQIKAGYTITF